MHIEAQASSAGLVWSDGDGVARSILPDTPAWYVWLADEQNQRLIYVHPSLGRFIMRHERKQRGGWYWSLYDRSTGRLRKAYLGKGTHLSLQKMQATAHSLVMGVAAPATPRSADLSAATPLLAAKLTPPPLRPRAVLRPRLLHQLSAGIERALTLLVAPAGSGKTSLLARWFEQVERAAHKEQLQTPDDTLRLAWLSLDNHDNDPARFLAYLCAACERLHPSVGAAPLGLLQAPQPIAIQTVLIILLNGLAAAQTSVLVLDDYHMIDNPAIHEAMSFALEHQPPNLRLIIAGRSLPALPIARLRGRGQLSELHARDLRFSPDEAHRFLTESMGIALTRTEAEALEQRTEGWAAGLYLVGLVAAGQGASAALAAASGNQRAIVDYLAAEVLAHQSASIQRFLLLTSILDRLCAPLCDALIDIDKATRDAPLPRAQFVLDELERANLFIVSLDDERHWYRYHQLFGDFLRDRLERNESDLLPELHRRAAQWYAHEGLMIEAVDHGLLADAQLAAELIEQCGRALLMRSAVMTVLGWIERLPAEIVAGRPQLALIAAWALAAAGRLDAAASQIDVAECALSVVGTTPELVGEVLAVRAAIAGLRRDLPTTVALCRAALAHLTPQQGYVRSVVSQLLGGAAYASGDTHGASQALSDALRFSHASGNLFITIFSTRQLADVRMAQGRMAEAERLYLQILGTDGSGLSGLPVAAMAAIGLGELYYSRNQHSLAESWIERGLAIGLQGQALEGEIVVRGSIALARLRLLAGDGDAAHELLTQAARLATESGIGWLEEWVQAERARLTMLLNDPGTALAWARSSGLSFDDVPSYLYESQYLVLAFIEIMNTFNEPDAARIASLQQFLEGLWADAEQSGRMNSQVAIAVLQAQAFHASGDTDAACTALLRALQSGTPSDYVRVYLDGGAVIAALLRRILRGHHLSPLLRGAATMLLAAFERKPAYTLPDSPDMLTSRELEVLTLLAAGRTNQQIAQALVISLGTVKKHLNNVYSKLGATSRTEAIARAHELGVSLL